MVFVFAPLHNANAQLKGIWDGGVALAGLFTSEVAAATHDGILVTTNSWYKAFLANLIAMLGVGIQFVLSIDIAGQAVVQESWDIVRGFANMFFILALIIMAFGTIFSVSKYDFRTLIARFLIAALLINFSLVIGEVIIDWTQSLSNVFITSIGDVGIRLAQGADTSKAFERAATVSQAGSAKFIWDETMASALNVILLSIMFFSMAVMFFFTLARIPILWALLIVSPIAWIMYILPNTRGIANKWWKQFMGWNLFLPIYLFFIYFGILFLSQKDRVLDAIAAQPVISAYNITFQMLFFYLLIGIVLIGGAKLAMGGSSSAGAGIVAGAIWARGRAAARWGGSAPFRLGRYGAGVGWRATGAEGVYKEAKDKFNKQGFAGFEATEKNLGKLYRGQQGREEMAARLGEATGLAPGLAQKQLSSNVDSAKKTFQERSTGENELRTILADPKADKSKKIAAAQRLQEEFGTALTAKDVSEMINSLGGTNSELAARSLRQVKWGEMSTEDLRKFTQRQITDASGNIIDNPEFILSDRNVESSALNALIERNRAGKEEIAKAIGLARGTAQKTSLIKKSKEYLNDFASSDDRKWLLDQLSTNAELGAQGEQGNESRVELLKTMAKKQDRFFHDSSGSPVQSELSAYANMFQNPTEMKAWLDDLSKKHADTVTAELMDRKLIKDDSGNEVKDVQEALKKVLSKLSIDEKLSQDKSQYNNARFQKALGTDMSRNINTLQSYLSNDKYSAASGNILEAQKQAREAIYVKQYYEPFAEQTVRANKTLRDIRNKAYQTQQALTQDLMRAGEEISELKKIRNKYEDLCRNNNILDTTAIAQRNNFDKGIQMLNERKTKITNEKKVEKQS